MACIRAWPFIGLSTYIVCRHGASKPVSHMSRTSTMRKGSDGSLNRPARSFRPCLVRMCCCQSGPSVAEPVITTFTAVSPFRSVSGSSPAAPAQSGRSFTMASCSSTQIRRLMQTTIALPSIASNRFSKWATRSAAITPMRSESPTTASNAAHLFSSLPFRSSASSTTSWSKSSSSVSDAEASIPSLTTRDS